MKELRAKSLLRKLAQNRTSKFLVSSRLFPADLQVSADRFRPGVQRYKLRGLDPHDAVELWNTFGMSGGHSTMTRLFDSVAGHPLTIKLIKGQIVAQQDPRVGNDLDKWLKSNPTFQPWSLQLVDDERKAHVLGHALTGCLLIAGRFFFRSLFFQLPLHTTF
jgi:hypothetical protein